MATLAMSVPDRQVSIGRVLGRAFGTIGSNPLTTLGVAFLLSALPQALINLFVRQLRGPNLAAMTTATGVFISLASALLGLVFYAMVQGSLVRATIDQEEGRKAGLGESLMAGLVVAVPLILMAIVSGVAMMVGFVLLLVPGIILFLMWSVSSPALVDEQLGVFEALGRSRFLTRGYRWRIFGMELLLLVVMWILSAITSVVMLTGGDFSLKSMAAAQQNPSIVAIVVTLILQTLISVVWGVCHASLFVELRNAKDGHSGEALAEVFR